MGLAHCKPSYREAKAVYVPGHQLRVTNSVRAGIALPSKAAAVCLWRAFIGSFPREDPFAREALFKNRRLDGDDAEDRAEWRPKYDPAPTGATPAAEHPYSKRAECLLLQLSARGLPTGLERELVHVMLGAHTVCGRRGVSTDGTPVDVAYTGGCLWYGSYAVWMWLLATMTLRSLVELGFRLFDEHHRRGFVTSGAQVVHLLRYLGGDEALAADARAGFREHLRASFQRHPCLNSDEPCVTLDGFAQLVITKCPATCASLLALQLRVRKLLTSAGSMKDTYMWSGAHLQHSVATWEDKDKAKALLRQLRTTCNCLSREGMATDVMEWTSKVRWPVNTVPAPKGMEASLTSTRAVEKDHSAFVITTASKSRGEGRQERAARAVQQPINVIPPWKRGPQVTASDEAAWAISVSMALGHATHLEDFYVGGRPVKDLQTHIARTWVSRDQHLCGAAVAITYLTGIPTPPSIPTVDAIGKVLPVKRRRNFGWGVHRLPPRRPQPPAEVEMAAEVGVEAEADVEAGVEVEVEKAGGDVDKDDRDSVSTAFADDGDGVSSGDDDGDDGGGEDDDEDGEHTGTLGSSSLRSHASLTESSTWSSSSGSTQQSSRKPYLRRRNPDDNKAMSAFVGTIVQRSLISRPEDDGDTPPAVPRPGGIDKLRLTPAPEPDNDNNKGARKRPPRRRPQPLQPLVPFKPLSEVQRGKAAFAAASQSAARIVRPKAVRAGLKNVALGFG